MSLASLMIHKVDIGHCTRTPDGVGGWHENWTAVVSDAPCRIRPLSAEEKARYGCVDVDKAWKVYFTSRTIGGHYLEEDDNLRIDGCTVLDIVGVRDIDECDRLCEALCTTPISRPSSP